MNNPEDNIKNYIQQLLKIQEEQTQKPLNEDELRKIADDLGLSPDDVALIKSKYKDYLARGLGYSRYEDWHSAAEEFKQAASLNPASAEALYGLALAYKNLARIKKDKELLNKAKICVKRTLQINPNHEPAYKLSAELNRGVEKLSNNNPFAETKSPLINNFNLDLKDISKISDFKNLPQFNQDNKLGRSVRNKKISGVCGGIAEYIGIDPTWVRIAFLMGAFIFGGFTIPVYIILAIILPKKY